MTPTAKEIEVMADAFDLVDREAVVRSRRATITRGVEAARKALFQHWKDSGMMIEAGAFESDYDGLIARTRYHPKHTTPVLILKRDGRE